MNIGIAGSRSLNVPIPEGILGEGVTMIYIGGAKGIDTSARDYGEKYHIPVTEILPKYNLYGRKAPLVRNELIVRMSDMVYVFWDGKSRGTKYVIKLCKEMNKPCEVYLWENDSFVLSENNE